MGKPSWGHHPELRSEGCVEIPGKAQGSEGGSQGTSQSPAVRGACPGGTAGGGPRAQGTGAARGGPGSVRASSQGLAGLTDQLAVHPEQRQKCYRYVQSGACFCDRYNLLMKWELRRQSHANRGESPSLSSSWGSRKLPPLGEMAVCPGVLGLGENQMLRGGGRWGQGGHL